jgi:hypothetical protein
MSEHTKPLTDPGQGFDPGEVDAPSVALYGGVIIVIIIAVFIGVTLFWDKFLNGRYKEVVEGAPNHQFEELHAREEAALGGYKYVDKTKGQVRIPLDRAMQLLLTEVQAGKAPYKVGDAPKVADPAAAAAPPAAAAAAATPTPAAAAEHH